MCLLPATYLRHTDRSCVLSPSTCHRLQGTMAALLAGCVAWRDRRQRGAPHATWHGWSPAALQGWGTYLR